MGMSAGAHLAYGYDLGTSEDFKAAERGKYGEPKLPWMTLDSDGDPEFEDFAEDVEKLLRKREAEKRVGVELAHSGHSDYAGWVLIAKHSERSVEWSEVMAVDLDELTNRPAYDGWDTKLADALTALGITPTQAGPKWLVFPSYG